MPIRYSPNSRPIQRIQPQPNFQQVPVYVPDNTASLIKELTQMKTDFGRKMIELDKKISIARGEKGTMGPPGRDGISPQIDEEALIKKIARIILSQIPKAKNGLPGRDGQSVNHEKVLEDLTKKVQEGKVKIKAEHIEGWQDPAEMLRRYVARGSLHGGGDTVLAGAGISAVKNSDGKTVITNTVSSGTAVFNEVAGGSGTAFTIAHTPTTGTLRVYALGQRLVPTTDYTQVGTAITTVNSWLANQIIIDYSY